MTISTELRKAGPFTGNGVTTAFPFSFKVFAATDVTATRADTLGAETGLVLNTDFTVALNADQDAAPGGTVTLAAPLSTGYRLVVSSAVPNLQPTDITNNGGFYPRVIEDALDRHVAQIQQIDEKVDRALKVAVTSPLGDQALPSPVAGMLIGWNESNDGLTNYAPIGGTLLGQQLAAANGSSLVGFQQAGTGAVVRTAQDKMREWVSVKDFGAVGDGVTDDTPAVTAAMNYAVSSGKSIYFPSGEYLLLTWTTFTSTSELCITGSSALIKGPVTPDLSKRFLKPQAKFTLDGIKFDRWSHVVRADDIDIGDLSGSVFSNNTVSGCVDQAIRITRHYDSLRISDNLFTNNTGGVVVYLGINTNAGQANWKNAVVSNNTFQDTSGTGNTSTAAIMNNGIYSTITGNRIRNVTSETGGAWGIYTKNLHSTVSNNIVSGVNASGAQQEVVGISIQGANRATVNSGTQGFSVVVAGNVVHTIGQQGIKGTGIRVQQSDVLVVGNRAEDCGVFNINVEDYNTCTDVIVSHNMTRQFNFSPSAAALKISSVGERFSVIGNIFQGGDKAISIGAVAGQLASVRISENQLIHQIGGGGVVFDNFGTLSALSITANTFDAVGGGTCIKAGTLGTITDSEVTNNNFSAAVAAGSTVKSAGINTAFRDNRGYVTRIAGTVTVPAGGGGLVVNHGLAGAPVSVTATPISQAATVQVHNITSTTFTLIHGLGSSVAVCWSAVTADEFN